MRRHMFRRFVAEPSRKKAFARTDRDRECAEADRGGRCRWQTARMEWGRCYPFSQRAAAVEGSLGSP